MLFPFFFFLNRYSFVHVYIKDLREKRICSSKVVQNNNWNNEKNSGFQQANFNDSFVDHSSSTIVTFEFI